MIRIIFIFICLASVACGQSIVKVQPGPITAPEPKKDITGILGAFPDEVQILLSQLEDKKESVFQRITFTEGKLRGQHVVVAFTGIGKVNASVATVLLLEHFHPRAILFSGIAGAINPALNPGDIVIGTKIAHHDYGVLTPEGTTRRPTRDPSTMAENAIYFSSDSVLIRTARQVAKSVSLEKVNSTNGPRAPIISEGVIVTGDVFVASNAATQELRQKMNAEATEMEGAAVAQVSHQQQVPFLIIRSMSDNAGNNAARDAESFYQLAARNSANFVMSILEAQTHSAR